MLERGQVLVELELFIVWGGGIIKRRRFAAVLC